MPRSRRLVVPDSAIHVVNRGNDRRVIFPQDDDYAAFLTLLREGRERFPIEVFGYNLIHNHFHLLLRAPNVKALSAYMHFVEREHSCDLRRISGTRGQGHIFQRRYWSKPVEGYGHFLTALKYVEANALRASLVKTAEQWEWGSLWERMTGDRDLLTQSPFLLPEDWRTIVNVPLQKIDLEFIRSSRRSRGRPSGRVDLRKPKK